LELFCKLLEEGFAYFLLLDATPLSLLFAGAEFDLFEEYFCWDLALRSFKFEPVVFWAGLANFWASVPSTFREALPCTWPLPEDTPLLSAGLVSLVDCGPVPELVTLVASVGLYSLDGLSLPVAPVVFTSGATIVAAPVILLSRPAE
jgi:hypothetical protein